LKLHSYFYYPKGFCHCTLTEFGRSLENFPQVPVSTCRGDTTQSLNPQIWRSSLLF